MLTLFLYQVCATREALQSLTCCSARPDRDQTRRWRRWPLPPMHAAGRSCTAAAGRVCCPCGARPSGSPACCRRAVCSGATSPRNAWRCSTWCVLMQGRVLLCGDLVSKRPATCANLILPVLQCLMMAGPLAPPQTHALIARVEQQLEDEEVRLAAGFRLEITRRDGLQRPLRFRWSVAKRALRFVG